MPTAEELARINIAKQLESCGWTVQSRNGMNRYAARLIGGRGGRVRGGGGAGPRGEVEAGSVTVRV